MTFALTPVNYTFFENNFFILEHIGTWASGNFPGGKQGFFRGEGLRAKILKKYFNNILKGNQTPEKTFNIIVFVSTQVL